MTTASTKPKSGDRTVVILGMVVLVAVLIGLNYSVMQIALRNTTPLVLTGMRLAVGATALGIYTRWRGEPIPRRPRVLLGIFGVSVCVTTFSSMTLVAGVNLVPAGVAALLSSMVPVWTAVLAFGLLGERLGPTGTLGVIVGLIGAVVLSSPAIGGETSLAGVAFMTFSGLTWAAGIVLLRWWDFEGASPVMIISIQLLMSTMVVVPIALIVEGTQDTNFGMALLLPLLYASIPAMALTFVLMAKVTVEASATHASSVAYLTPLFGVLFAWIIRNNRLSAAEWVGGALLVLGVVLVTKAVRPTPDKDGSELPTAAEG